MDYMFRITSDTDYLFFQRIDGGGIINGDKKATNLVELNYFSNFYFERLQLKNAKNISLATRTDGTPSPAGLFMRDCYIRNDGTDYTNVNNIGISVNCTDSIFENVIIRDINIGVDVICSGGNNVFIKVHPWISTDLRLANSISYRCGAGSSSHFISCDSDSMLIGWKVLQQAEVHCYSNCTFISHPAFVYPSQPVIFSVDSNHWYLKVVDCNFNGDNTYNNSHVAIGVKLCDLTYITGYFQGNRYTGLITNKILDIYQMPSPLSEPVFVPVLSGSTTAGTHTYISRPAKYTRFGTLITAMITLSCTVDNTIAGDLQISGLPFNAILDTPVIILPISGFISTTKPIYGKILTGTTTIKLYDIDGVAIDSTLLRGSTINLQISATYIV
jgi:hypothetical protein